MLFKEKTKDKTITSDLKVKFNDGMLGTSVSIGWQQLPTVIQGSTHNF